jgi:hypothetical protein
LLLARALAVLREGLAGYLHQVLDRSELGADVVPEHQRPKLQANPTSGFSAACVTSSGQPEADTQGTVDCLLSVRIHVANAAGQQVATESVESFTIDDRITLESVRRSNSDFRRQANAFTCDKCDDGAPPSAH